MNKIAIEAKGLSKHYHIGRLRDQKLTLQERVLRAALAPFRRILGLIRGRAAAAADLDESFWALRDVSFTIEQGEVVGIIGSNGAGKSTLLKLLSRITEPTHGSAVVRGRVGSLLEVGTGFHPELTGRENVFLNGSILGMRKSEVARKFDEIIAFSEVGKFIDTPVKHFSSGMRVRLAFAVAAHVDPEVLIVDEVLAVGDARFRKKCMDKMQDVAKTGTTVLFVSHSAQTVTSLCKRVIWLEGGTVVKDGPAMETVSDYLGGGLGLSADRSWPLDDAPGGDIARLTGIRIRTEAGEVTDCVDVRQRFCVEADIHLLEAGHGILMLHGLQNSDGTQVFSAVDTENPVLRKKTWPVGKHVVRMWVPGNLLQATTHTVETFVSAWEPREVKQLYERDLLCFHVIDSFAENSARGHFAGTLPGVVRPLLTWESEHRQSKLRPVESVSSQAFT